MGEGWGEGGNNAILSGYVFHLFISFRWRRRTPTSHEAVMY